MSALEIIEQIKSLRPEEQAEVVKFVRQIEAGLPCGEARYMDQAAFDSAKQKVFAKHSELLDKLAR